MTDTNLDTIERELDSAEPSDFAELLHYTRLLVEAHRRLLRTADDLNHENARLRKIEAAVEWCASHGALVEFMSHWNGTLGRPRTTRVLINRTHLPRSHSLVEAVDSYHRWEAGP